jgi:hypothetical protein
MHTPLCVNTARPAHELCNKAVWGASKLHNLLSRTPTHTDITMHTAGYEGCCRTLTGSCTYMYRTTVPMQSTTMTLPFVEAQHAVTAHCSA